MQSVQLVECCFWFEFFSVSLFSSSDYNLTAQHNTAVWVLVVVEALLEDSLASLCTLCSHPLYKLYAVISLGVSIIMCVLHIIMLVRSYMYIIHEKHIWWDQTSYISVSSLF